MHDSLFHTLQDFMTTSEGITYSILVLSLVSFVFFWRFLTDRDHARLIDPCQTHTTSANKWARHIRRKANRYEQRRLIWMCDDEMDVRDYLTAILEDAEYTVRTASDGFEAMESILQEKPDLITLDIMMPNETGVGFYRHLRK